jgi:hypothetical protein
MKFNDGLHSHLLEVYKLCELVDHTCNNFIRQAFFFCIETNKNFHQEFSWTKLFVCIISVVTEKDLLIEMRAIDDFYNSHRGVLQERLQSRISLQVIAVILHLLKSLIARSFHHLEKYFLKNNSRKSKHYMEEFLIP